jgi:predicted amidohydrolase
VIFVRINAKKLLKFISVILTAATLTGAVLCGTTAGALDYTSGEYANEMNIAVVNFNSEWGNINKNYSQMLEYAQQAEQEGVDFLVFPEMALNGYAYSNYSGDEKYKMAVDTAITADGEIAGGIAQAADDYDMWIIFGATEKIAGDYYHAYNSAFCCSPDGEIYVYEKIHTVEGDWCRDGSEPLILDTKWGNIGLSICYDTYAVPELTRYYTAMGCRMIVNPTASTKGCETLSDGSLDTEAWQWYYQNRLVTYDTMDGVFVASANLCGAEYNSSGNMIYNFPGGSCVIGASSDLSDATSYEYYAGSPSDSSEGMKLGKINLDSCNSTDIISKDGSSFDSNFKPELYSSWYADLADYSTLEIFSYPNTKTAIISTVSFKAELGDLDANLAQMKNYIEDAAEKGTNILVFPEMALQGYCIANSPDDAYYRLAVDKAITKDGYYANEIKSLAEEYNMYIIFGASEVIPDEDNPDNDDMAYNSAFCCTPNGEVYSYQKIHTVEGSWCKAGTTPVAVDTPYGAIGLSICEDTYACPELQRYYAAKRCTYIANPTAIIQDEDTGANVSKIPCYSGFIENIADLNKMVVISASLCGEQETGESSEYAPDNTLTFDGCSSIVAPLNVAVDGSYVEYISDSPYDASNVGLITATLDMSKRVGSSMKYSLLFSKGSFRYELYTKWYAQLARLNKLYGDVDGDGKLSIADVTCIQKYIAGYDNLDLNLSLGDVNADGIIGIEDATAIQKILVGIAVY